jgi:hypothetical protein
VNRNRPLRPIAQILERLLDAACAVGDRLGHLHVRHDQPVPASDGGCGPLVGLHGRVAVDRVVRDLRVEPVSQAREFQQLAGPSYYRDRAARFEAEAHAKEAAEVAELERIRRRRRGRPTLRNCTAKIRRVGRPAERATDCEVRRPSAGAAGWHRRECGRSDRPGSPRMPRSPRTWCSSRTARTGKSADAAALRR